MTNILAKCPSFHVLADGPLVKRLTGMRGVFGNRRLNQNSPFITPGWKKLVEFILLRKKYNMKHCVDALCPRS